MQLVTQKVLKVSFYARLFHIYIYFNQSSIEAERHTKRAHTFTNSLERGASGVFRRIWGGGQIFKAGLIKDLHKYFGALIAVLMFIDDL